MTLSNDQLQYIRDAIVKVNRVKYQDFFEEIYGHYIISFFQLYQEQFKIKIA
jgi:hypothetical protein